MKFSAVRKIWSKGSASRSILWKLFGKSSSGEDRLCPIKAEVAWHSDKDAGRSIIVISQSPAGFKRCVNEGSRMSLPLSHLLTDGRARDLPTSPLHNGCMTRLVWGNKIAACFVFSWPGLMLASAAQRLFISSGAVAIYPAASTDNSTISHQQQ